jgi:redox-sensitive bicupin YhaK (pirin superfamily)
LPEAAETAEPTFEHVRAADLPSIELDGAGLRLIAGQAYGAKSPVATASPLFYLDAALETEARLDLPPELGERGIYIVAGEIEIDGFDYGAGRLLALANERPCEIRARAAARLMLLGGAALGGDRAIWWNFVASDEARIEAAKQDWAGGRFAPVTGDDEHMPLPV